MSLWIFSSVVTSFIFLMIAPAIIPATIPLIFGFSSFFSFENFSIISQFGNWSSCRSPLAPPHFSVSTVIYRNTLKTLFKNHGILSDCEMEERLINNQKTNWKDSKTQKMIKSIHFLRKSCQKYFLLGVVGKNEINFFEFKKSLKGHKSWKIDSFKKRLL